MGAGMRLNLKRFEKLGHKMQKKLKNTKIRGLPKNISQNSKNPTPL
jgi:hypothetical protein